MLGQRVEKSKHTVAMERHGEPAATKSATVQGEVGLEAGLRAMVGAARTHWPLRKISSNRKPRVLSDEAPIGFC